MTGFLRNSVVAVTVLAAWLALMSGSVFAAIDTYEFSNDELRIRYRILATELRCPKCQNQNIADSNAPVAMDLRAQLYRLLNEGHSDAEIIEYMVNRYGEFIHYRPPLNAQTVLLWGAPILFMLSGIVMLLMILRKTSIRASSVLNETEQAALRDLVGDVSNGKEHQ